MFRYLGSRDEKELSENKEDIERIRPAIFQPYKKLSMVSMDCLDDENPIVVVLSLTHARKNRLGCKDFLDSFLFLIFSVIKKKSVF